MISEFALHPPRETSGSRSANRFDYQLSWAFCLLLDLESNPDGYILVLDHHDDVVVFDSEQAPEAADFFQIKTETRNKWTLAKLIARKEGTHSILGKLYGHKLDFGDRVRSLNFISNQIFSLETETGKPAKDLEDAKLSDLCATAIAKASETLKKEHGLNDLSISELEFVFKTDSLTPKGHQLHAEGKLSQYLKNTFGDKPYFVSNAFVALIDYLKRRNNYEGTITSEEDMLAYKCITKSKFSPLLARSARLGDKDTWARLENMLSADGVGLGILRKYHSIWQAKEIELLEYSNTIAQETQEIADEIVLQIISNNEDCSASSIVTQSIEAISQHLQDSKIPFGDNDIKGMALVAIVKALQ